MKLDRFESQVLRATIADLTARVAPAVKDPAAAATWTPEHVATFYQTNTTLIICGLILLGFGACLYLPWCAAISTQMRRIEGEHSVLAWAQLGLGSIFVWVFFLPVMIWIWIAYRPFDTPPELMWRMNDLAWLCFINPVCIVFFQGLAIGGRLPEHLDRDRLPAGLVRPAVQDRSDRLERPVRVVDTAHAVRGVDGIDDDAAAAGDPAAGDRSGRGCRASSCSAACFPYQIAEFCPVHVR